MSLKYLIYVHHLIYALAIMGAIFFGMVVQYNLKMSAHQAEIRATTAILLQVSAEQLGELRI